MKLIYPLFLALIVGSSVAGCVGRDRRPVVVATATSQSTSPFTEKQPMIADRDRGAEKTDEVPSGSDGKDPKETVSGGSADPDAGKPDAPGKDKPGSGGGSSGTGGGAGSKTPGPIRYSVNLPDGTTKTLEWDGKALKGNDLFDVVRGQ